MTITVRLDAETEALVHRIARRRGQTKSALVHDAIRDFASRTQKRGRQSAYEKVEHLLGCVDSGGRDLSRNTGEKFRHILLEKVRERRSR